MKYDFSFYKEEDYQELVRLVLASYEWEYPNVGLSRIEFSHRLHPSFTGNRNAWAHTVGVYKQSGKIVACVWNEGTYDGHVYFLFDNKERGEDLELLIDMVKFTKTFAAGLKEDGRTRTAAIYIPVWHETLRQYVLAHGFHETQWEEAQYILPFDYQEKEVCLPEGYQMLDGHTTPDFYLSNVHRFAFNYGGENYATEHGEAAFNELRKSRYYEPDLDLCVIDPMGRPVAIAILWYDGKMPYCELEPLGVVWWERRKGIATNLMNEAINRVMKKYPKCQGMLGGDQTFYQKVGYEKKGVCKQYAWEAEIIISWEPASYDKDYKKEVE